MSDDFTRVLEEIKIIIIRNEESQKTILKNVETILKDIDKIKEDISDHQSDIVVMRAENKYIREMVESIKLTHSKEIDIIWDSLRNMKSEQGVFCEKKAQEFEKKIEESKKETSNGIKLWVYAIAIALLVSLFGSAIYVGTIINRITVLEENKK